MQGDRLPSLAVALILSSSVVVTVLAAPAAGSISAPTGDVFRNRTLPGGDTIRQVDENTSDSITLSQSAGWSQLGAGAWVRVVADPCAEGDAYLVRVQGGTGARSGYGLGPLGPSPVEGGPEEMFRQMSDVKYDDPFDDGDRGSDDGPFEDDPFGDWLDERWEALQRTWPEHAGKADRDASTGDGPPIGVTAGEADWENVSSCDSVNGDNADDQSPSDFVNEGLDIWTEKACDWVEWLAPDVQAPDAGRDVTERAEEATPCRILSFARVPETNTSLVDGLLTDPVSQTDEPGRRPGAGYGMVRRDAGEDTDRFGSGLLHRMASMAQAAVVGSGASTTARAVGYAVVAVSLAGLALYRRLSKDDILDNDLRAGMLEVVEANPGINASALAGKLDVAVTTVLYHGRVLDDAGHLVKRKVGGEVTFFTTDQGGTLVERELLCALNQQGKGDLLTLLADESGLNISEAARRLDRNRSTIKRHADDLVERGLLEDGRDGRSRTLSLSGEVRRAVEEAT